MAQVALFLSSLGAVVLLVIHCWRRRGGRMAAAFFLPGILFGLARCNVVYFTMKVITGKGLQPYVPQAPFLPEIGHASLQITIGWLFAGYLAWTFSEYVLRRVRWERRLFATVAMAGLFMACMGWCMESIASKIGWWYWDLSMRNAVFGDVPGAGIAAWFSVAFDFLFPVLLIVCSQRRRSPWRWLALLVFPAHFGAHMLYNTVPHIDSMYALIVVIAAALALFNRTQLETGFLRRPDGPKTRAGILVDLIPAVAMVTFLAVMLRASLAVGNVALMYTAFPLAVFALLAYGRIPVVAVLVAALAGLTAWGVVSFRAVYVLAPLVGLGVLYGAAHPRWKRPAERAGLALVVLLAGAYVTTDEIVGSKLTKVQALVRTAHQSALAGNAAAAQDALRQALAVHFNEAGAISLTVDYLLASRPLREAVLPVVRKRIDHVIELDPEWTRPRIESLQLSLLDGELDTCIRDARALVRLQPTTSLPHLLLGYLLLREGSYVEAEGSLRAALRLGSRDPSVLPDLDLAEKSAQAGVESPPGIRDVRAPDVLSPLAVIAADRGVAAARAAAPDWPKSVREMRLSVHFAPDDPATLTNAASVMNAARLALTREAAGRTGAEREALAAEAEKIRTEAVGYCEKSLKLQPDLGVTQRVRAKLKMH